MANLYRLAFILFALVWSAPAHAAGSWSFHSPVGCGSLRVDKDLETVANIAAAFLAAAQSTCTGNNHTLLTVNEDTGLATYQCSIKASGASCGIGNIQATLTPCAAGQTRFPGNGQCYPTCTPPAKQSVAIDGTFNGCLVPGGSKEAICANSKGVKENYYSTPAPALANQICQKLGPNTDCAIDITWSSSVTTGGIKTLYGIGVGSGKTCTQAAADNAAASPVKPAPTDANAQGAPAPTPCKPGTYTGTVNGVSVCVPSSGAEPVEQSGTTTTTNPDGSKTTKSSTTSCDGANCTTTTTTTTVPSSGGAGTSTTTKEEKPKETFCQENPALSICKSGSFGGNCTAGFTCDGDALQCSIAREQYARNCQMFDKATPESSLYDTEKVKTGDQTTALPGNQSITLSASSFSQAPVFASQGLQDLHVTVAGKDNTIDMSRLNSWLEILGYIGVSITALVCVRVVFGGGA